MKSTTAEKGLFITIFWLPLVNIIMYIGLAISFAGSFAKLKLSEKKNALDWSIIIFTIIIFISVLTSVNKILSIYGFIAFCAYPIAYFVFSKNINERNLSKITDLIVLSLLVVIIGGILQAVLVVPGPFLMRNEKFFRFLKWDTDIPIWHGARLVSTLGNPNALGAYLVLVLPVLLCIFLQKPSRKVGITFILGTLILLLTYSKSACIGFFVGILVISLLSRKRVLFLFSLLLLTTFLAIPGISNRFKSSINSDVINSPSGRLTIWKTSADIIRQYPITGTGVNTFGEVFQKFQKQHTEDIFSHAHNIFLQIGVEAGISGMIAFIVLLISFFLFSFKFCSRFKLYKTLNFQQWTILGLMGGISGFVVQNFFDCFFTRGQIGVLFFLMMGIIRGLSNL